MRSDRPRVGTGLLAFLFLFVSCNTAFIGGAALSDQVDAANRTIAWAIFVPLAISTVIFAFGLRRAVIGGWLTARRWARFDDRLAALGLRPATPAEVERTQRLPAHVLAPAILGTQRGGGIDHVRIGMVDGREVRCCNARVRGGAWTDAPVVAIRVDGSFPPTVVWSNRVTIPPRPGMRRMRFELEAFNRAFSVYSTDRYFASAVIDARMIDRLLSVGRGLTLELSDRWLVAWRFPRWDRPPDPFLLLDVLGELADRLPRVIPSLFPDGGDEILWAGRRGEIHLPPAERPAP